MSTISKRYPFKARYLGKLGDLRVHRYTVQYRCTDTTSRDFDYVEGQVGVTAESPAAAVAHVLDSGDWESPVEAWTWGPRGGLTERRRGWEALVWHKVEASANALKQLNLWR